MRLIARLDIKNDYVIKGVSLEGLRKIGNPFQLAKKYYNEGVDELIFIDQVASLYKRNNLFNLIEYSSKEVFVPITLGGGIRNNKDIELAIKSGADKVSINTAAIEDKKFLKKAVKNFGSSTIISYIETKKIEDKWIIYKNAGRDNVNIELIEWIKFVQDNGCGEIMLTSIDFEGRQNGFDIELINKVYNSIKVPIIISGGCSSEKDILYLRNNFKNASVAIASCLHYNKINIKNLKKKIDKNLYT